VQPHEIGIMAGFIALLVAAVVAHLRYWSRRLDHPLAYAETERHTTRDGSAFELRRITTPSATDTLPPILIIHGLAANHRNDDLDEEASLARHLARSGRDVWLITLRCGRRDRTLAEGRLATFTAMAKHDVPDAVRRVLARTASASLDYIGFSMGGMLAYATLGATVPSELVRRVVIVGSPARVRIPLPVLHRLRGLPSWIAPPAPFRVLSHLYAFAVEAFTTPIHRISINPDNVAPGKLRRTMVNMVEDVPASLNRELAKWALSDGKICVDDEPVLPRLATLQQPVRFFAGAADNLAPADAIKPAFEAWGSPDKHLFVLGTAQGYSADYGHGDLAIGRNAAVEIYEPIRVFLAECGA
jgi:polyhydroxyalkanoate synthase subunit PhaC